MATSLGLGFGKRDQVGGPITRLSGRFKTSLPGATFGQVYVTDCIKYFPLGRRVPVANPAFSIPRAELTNKTKNLDNTRDWYVYVQVTNGKGGKESSNAYEFPKDKKTRRDTKKNITQIKKTNLAQLLRAIGVGEKEIARIGKDAERQNDAATALIKRGVPYIPGWLLDSATKKIDEMAKLRKRIDKLEKEAKAREADLKKRFGIEPKSNKPAR